jgi:hypothetical protein
LSGDGNCFIVERKSEVTQDIMPRIESGDPAASEQLLPLVFNELHKLPAATDAASCSAAAGPQCPNNRHPEHHPDDLPA